MGAEVGIDTDGEPVEGADTNGIAGATADLTACSSARFESRSGNCFRRARVGARELSDERDERCCGLRRGRSLPSVAIYFGPARMSTPLRFPFSS